MSAELERLKRARLTMMNIVATRSDGASYVPIFLRLEQELRNIEGSKDEYQRILDLAAGAAA